MGCNMSTADRHNVNLLSTCVLASNPSVELVGGRSCCASTSGDTSESGVRLE